MASRHGDHNTVSDQVTKTGQAVFDLGNGWISSMFHMIIINIFYNISVEFLLRTDQRLDPALERKRQKRILPRHILIKFSDLLRLRSKEIIMLQKLRDLQQKITMRQIDLIPALPRIPAEIPRIIMKDPQKRIS